MGLSFSCGALQVLEQCQRWCPDPERLFTSVGPEVQPGPAAASSRAPEGSPGWGWDHLKFSGGDSLNPGDAVLPVMQLHPRCAHMGMCGRMASRTWVPDALPVPHHSGILRRGHRTCVGN